MGERKNTRNVKMAINDIITVDDIQIGHTADVQWKKVEQGKVVAIYPAILQKSRVVDGVIQYRVHYKNWNKRYDEWVELDRIMRVYDDKGDMVKSRVPDETDEKKAVSTRRSINLRNKSKSAGDDDDENDEDGIDGETEEEDEDEPLRPSAPVSYHFGDSRPKPGEVEDEVSALDLLGHSDSDSDGDEKPKDAKSRKCAAPNCESLAQPDSIYCSVACIMRHAKAMQAKPDQIPALEDAPPEMSDDDAASKGDASSDEYEPVEKKAKKKVEKSPKQKKRKKEGEKSKAKVANVPKKLNTQDIDMIMARVADMPYNEPFMVMRSGALLTGYSAPRKHNLRAFLEANPVGTKIIWNEKIEKKTPMQRPSKSLTLSSKHREQKAKDEKKKQRPIAKITPITKKPAEENEPSGPFGGTAQTNM